MSSVFTPATRPLDDVNENEKREINTKYIKIVIVLIVAIGVFVFRKLLPSVIVWVTIGVCGLIIAKWFADSNTSIQSGELEESLLTKNPFPKTQRTFGGITINYENTFWMLVCLFVFIFFLYIYTNKWGTSAMLIFALGVFVFALMVLLYGGQHYIPKSLQTQPIASEKFSSPGFLFATILSFVGIVVLLKSAKNISPTLVIFLIMVGSVVIRWVSMGSIIPKNLLNEGGEAALRDLWLIRMLVIGLIIGTVWVLTKTTLTANARMSPILSLFILLGIPGLMVFLFRMFGYTTETTTTTTTTTTTIIDENAPDDIQVNYIPVLDTNHSSSEKEEYSQYQPLNPAGVDFCTLKGGGNDKLCKDFAVENCGIDNTGKINVPCGDVLYQTCMKPYPTKTVQACLDRAQEKCNGDALCVEMNNQQCIRQNQCLDQFMEWLYQHEPNRYVDLWHILKLNGIKNKQDLASANPDQIMSVWPWYAGEQGSDKWKQTYTILLDLRRKANG